MNHKDVLNLKAISEKLEEIYKELKNQYGDLETEFAYASPDRTSFFSVSGSGVRIVNGYDSLDEFIKNLSDNLSDIVSQEIQTLEELAKINDKTRDLFAAVNDVDLEKHFSAQVGTTLSDGAVDLKVSPKEIVLTFKEASGEEARAVCFDRSNSTIKNPLNDMDKFPIVFLDNHPDVYQRLYDAAELKIREAKNRAVKEQYTGQNFYKAADDILAKLKESARAKEKPNLH